MTVEAVGLGFSGVRGCEGWFVRVDTKAVGLLEGSGAIAFLWASGFSCLCTECSRLPLTRMISSQLGRSRRIRYRFLDSVTTYLPAVDEYYLQCGDVKLRLVPLPSRL